MQGVFRTSYVRSIYVLCLRGSQPPKKKKRGHVDGWCAATIDTLLKNMDKNKAMRAGTVTQWFMNLWISTTILQQWSGPIYIQRKCLPLKPPHLWLLIVLKVVVDRYHSENCWPISFGELLTDIIRRIVDRYHSENFLSHGFSITPCCFFFFVSDCLILVRNYTQLVCVCVCC